MDVSGVRGGSENVKAKPAAEEKKVEEKAPEEKPQQSKNEEAAYVKLSSSKAGE